MRAVFTSVMVKDWNRQDWSESLLGLAKPFSNLEFKDNSFVRYVDSR